MTEKKIPELWSKIRCAALLVAFNLLWIIPCGIKYEQDYLTGPNEETVITEEITTESEAVSIDPVLAQAVYIPREVSLGTFKLTAYCPCARCCSKSDGITSTGTVATQGRTVAVDPSVIPYGTVLIINGKEYVAEDSGGKWIQKKEIDIFFDSHQEALEFGIQYTEVLIKESN